jgi:alpha-amylase
MAMKKNPTLIQFFEWYCRGGQHWDHFKDQINQLTALGITAVWLPPAYKGTRGAQSEGYDVYDIYDLGEFDQKGSIATKYGTREEYLDAIEQARKAGLKIYIDVVLNHMGGAEEPEKVMVRKVDPKNRLKFITEKFEIEAYTRFTFPGRNGKYSSFNWNHQCFTGIDHAIGADEPAIYCICNESGDDWEPLVHHEKGNFDYLILNDIETRNPAVREELKRWAKWYYETVPFDGVRLDAVKHVNPSFFIEWLDYLRAEVNPELFALGEYWLSDDLPVLLKYIDATKKRMSLFDAPLHHNFSEASVKKEKYDLRNILKETLVAVHPDLAVTFVDNHDTQPLQSLEEYTEQWFKPHAYALILLRDAGYPCVFYADLYGAHYTGKNKQLKHCEISIPALSVLPILLRLRSERAYGVQIDYWDDQNCVGWTRQGTDDKPLSGLAVLISNAATTMVKKMNVGRKLANQSLINVTDPLEEPVIVDGNGDGTFIVGPQKMAVWALSY